MTEDEIRDKVFTAWREKALELIKHTHLMNADEEGHFIMDEYSRLKYPLFDEMVAALRTLFNDVTDGDRAWPEGYYNALRKADTILTKLDALGGK